MATSTFPSSPTDTAHATTLLEVVELLQRAGHRVSVLTQQRAESPTPPLPGLEVTWFRWRQQKARLAELSFSSPSALVSAASLLYRGTQEVRARRESVDVFLCGWVIPSGFYTYVNSLFASGKPYVLWAFGSDVNKYKSSPIMRGVLRRILRGAGHIYADGFELCDTIRDISGRECEFLPSFRTLAKEPRPVHVAGDGPKRFLYVGRHTPVKGTDVLVDALLALEQSGETRYQCAIAGDGDLTPALHAKVERAGLGARVQFLGRLSDAELASEYARADCLVIPSRSESIPLVMGEGLQYGLPFIVTRVGDMETMAQRFGLGKVVPPERPDELARALREFIGEPWRLEPTARAEALGELSFEQAAPKLISRLEALVTETSSR